MPKEFKRNSLTLRETLAKKRREFQELCLAIGWPQVARVARDTCTSLPLAITYVTSVSSVSVKQGFFSGMGQGSLQYGADHNVYVYLA
jgi:hypothetical protein